MHRIITTHFTWDFSDGDRGTIAKVAKFSCDDGKMFVRVKSITAKCTREKGSMQIEFLFNKYGGTFWDVESALHAWFNRVFCDCHTGHAPYDMDSEMREVWHTCRQSLPITIFPGVPAAEQVFRKFLQVTEILGLEIDRLYPIFPIPTIEQRTTVRVRGGKDIPFGEFLARKFYPEEWQRN